MSSLAERRSWRLSALLREGWLAVSTGGFRVAILLLSTAAVSSLLSAVEAAEVNTVVVREGAAVAGGLNVFVIAPGVGTTSGVDAAACEALSREDGIIASGAEFVARLENEVDFPSDRVNVSHATRGMLKVVGDDPAQMGGLAPATSSAAVVGTDVARRLGLGPGSIVRLGSPSAPDTIVVAHLTDALRRYPYADRTIFEIEPAVGSARRCLVEMTAGAAPYLGKGGVFALADLSEVALTISPLISDSGLQPSTQYRERVSRYAALLSAIIILLLAEALRLARRAELGLYRAVGSSRLEIGMILAIEYICILAGSALISVPILLAIAASKSWVGVSIDHGVYVISLGLLLALLFRLPLLLLGYRRNIIDSLKDR
jgi:hypothetical protein